MIRARKVRVIGSDSNQIGVMDTNEALEIALKEGLDLVEVSSDANPPVCKIINYGKYKYELSKKSKEAKKHQKMVILKEIKVNPKIGKHDLMIKTDHIRKFIESGFKVKVTVTFKGRQITHTEFGMELLLKVISLIEDISTVEMKPKLEGRNMIMMLIPK